ncbi:MAG: hypothetical protein V1904_00700 [Bacteroidota bacterium]
MKVKKIFSGTILFFILAAAYPQTRVNSPYTRYGIGDLLNSKYIRNISMGGISFGYRSPYSVNYSNPASYTAFDTLSFMFESGVNSSFTQMKSSTQEQLSNYTSLSYLVFGFPVTKWWGASIGLLPYSSVGYNIIDTENLENVGLLNYYYEGAGGFNQFYVGNAIRIKNFSVGCNASLLFGSLDKICSVTLPDSTDFLSAKMRYSTVTNDFLFNYGLQYQKKLGSKIKMVAGLAFNTTTNLNSKQDTLAYRYFYSETYGETIKDTIINSIDNKGTITLPQSIGAGATFGFGYKWLVGADYQVQNWKNYKAFGESDLLENSMQASIGMEFTPNYAATTQRWKRAHYRMGFRYNQTYLKLHDTQLDEIGISFGLGLPLKKSKTTMNLGFEIGQRGTTDNNLIKERFARVIFSLSVHEFWFIKRRFD